MKLMRPDPGFLPDIDQLLCYYEVLAFFHFTNGINPKGIVYLKYKNIQNCYLMTILAKGEGPDRYD